MDWYSWLSRTALDPSLIRDYGLAFSRNHLQREDLAQFNHQFLQSMGVSVAKHRLEILKLARKEVDQPSNSQSKLILAINKTRKCFNRCVNKLVHHQHYAIESLPEPVRYRDQWRGVLTRKCKSEKEVNIEQPVPRTRKIAKSGPLDYREQEKKLLAPPRSLKLSGPLDRETQEKLVLVIGVLHHLVLLMLQWHRRG
ncbi:Detected protein of confused Function [Hibiscus syriacus]|uniref:Detected protein of confused Function n=1 Tax=Hibiscus syriacus TaxID=106335 RepID=A0A6A2X2I5_HIBSY|nr:uncharacterized protein LOC120176911 [Hibiscus syriacus]KAE8669062.1 Detected protein of confused Function [Hibiscus syriacus]